MKTSLCASLLQLLLTGALALPHPQAGISTAAIEAQPASTSGSVSVETPIPTGAPSAVSQDFAPTIQGPQVGTGSETAAPAVSTANVPASISSASNACASIGSLQREFKQSAGPKPASTFTAPMSLATECLASVPLFKALSLQHIDMLKKYAELQSTVSMLKNVPESGKNMFPKPIDMIGDLDALAEKVEAGGIPSHSAFEVEVMKVFAAPNDGHLVAIGSVLRQVTYRLPLDLVSLSEDGKKLPKIFAVKRGAGGALQFGTNAITAIDGMDPSQYVEEITKYEGLQGSDARYNQAFIGKNALGVTVAGSAFYSRGQWQPSKEDIEVTYEDGRIEKFSYHAVFGDFSKINSGLDLFNTYALVAPPAQSSAAGAAAERGTGPDGDELVINSGFASSELGPETAALEETHIAKLMKERLNSTDALAVDAANPPTPIAQDKSNFFVGFFLDGTTTAVMRVSSFAPDDKPAFSQAVSKFITECQAKGMTNLLVDCQSNGGGSVLLGYDLFEQLFPADVHPYSEGNIRLTDATRIMMDAFKDISVQKKTDAIAKNDTRMKSNIGYAVAADLAYQAMIDTSTGKKFASEAAFLGPDVRNGDNYTNMYTFDNTDPVFGLGLNKALDPGFFARPPRQQPFKAENIVFMTDGSCSSTCSTFAEYLHQKGVRTVALGGLPQLKPMAHVGGVRGMHALRFNVLQLSAAAVDYLAPTTDAEEKQRRKDALPAALPFNLVGGLNWANNYRKDVDSALQFVEDFADCKLFYTREMFDDVSNLWKTIAGLAFKTGGGTYTGHDGCAVGTLEKDVSAPDTSEDPVATSNAASPSVTAAPTVIQAENVPTAAAIVSDSPVAPVGTSPATPSS